MQPVSCINGHSFLGEKINQFVYLTLGIRCANDLSEGFAIFVSLSAALTTGTLAYFFSLRRDLINIRNTNTDRFLLQNNEDLICDLQRFGEKIISEEMNAITQDDVSRELASWNRIYSHLEKLSVAIKYGLVSEAYIVSVERSIILRCFQSSQTCIVKYRRYLNNEHYLSNYQSLYFRTLLGKKIPWRIAIILENIPFVKRYSVSNLLLSIEFYFMKLLNDIDDDLLNIHFKDLKRVRKHTYLKILALVFLYADFHMRIN